MRRMRFVFVLLMGVGIVGAGAYYASKQDGWTMNPAQTDLAATQAKGSPSDHASGHDKDHGKVHGKNQADHSDHAQTQVAGDVPDSGDSCHSVEILGRGPERAGISKDHWAATLDLFHEVKKTYKDWFESKREHFGAKVADRFSAQIQDLRIQRPPTPDEPDLAWRGIVVSGIDHKGGMQLIRVGDGFGALIKKEPHRARFELARAMAQTLSPCDSLWAPLAECLEQQEPKKSCQEDAYSETSWAITTAIAVQIAPPGCTIPALQSDSAQACLWKLPMKSALKEAHL